MQTKTYTPEALGYGAKNPRELKYKKLRFEVLDRLSKQGQGLSDAQKADFAWFKDAWDEFHLEGANAVDWGLDFSTIVQAILNQITAGKTNAFSQMVCGETRRMLMEKPALRL